MKATLRLLMCAALLVSCAALAQVQVRIAVPTFRFAVRPPLVEVAPGVQVVQDSNEEIFFANGAYWCRRDGRWYRADNDQRWAWRPARHHVPMGLMHIPAGRYRHFHGHPMRHPAPVMFHGPDHHELRHEEHRELRHEEHHEAVHQEMRHEAAHHEMHGPAQRDDHHDHHDHH